MDATLHFFLENYHIMNLIRFGSCLQYTALFPRGVIYHAYLFLGVMYCINSKDARKKKHTLCMFIRT